MNTTMVLIPGGGFGSNANRESRHAHHPAAGALTLVGCEQAHATSKTAVCDRRFVLAVDVLLGIGVLSAALSVALMFVPLIKS